MPKAANTPVSLQSALENALADKNFSFEGSFYHSSLLKTAPNPCLSIAGIGVVGLPLSERDAKAVVSCSKLAPFGHKEKTVVNKKVRNTWEVDPSKISFDNPEWEEYINTTICAQVCKSLGVKFSEEKTGPTMELYKMLVYEKGSHFLPHQDTPKAKGMFATVILLLPSLYTGGEVILSHSSMTTTIDYSEESGYSSALLAWYTDVQHEVKHVTSGHRIALAYNLIQATKAREIGPRMPNMSPAMTALRKVFEKWNEEKYTSIPENGLVAYLLSHQYNDIDLSQGLKGLKGVDAHRVKWLQPIAEEMGYMVGLACIEHHMAGCANDEFKPRYYSSDDDEEYNGYRGNKRGPTPSFLEIEDETTSITGLVDLEGNVLIAKAKGRKLDLQEGSLIPENPFERKKPDRTEYEGYLGNGAGGLEYWYHRTAMVLLKRTEVDDLCYSAEGPGYALRKLENGNTPPSDEDRAWALRILDSQKELEKVVIEVLISYALAWKEIDLWDKISQNNACNLKSISCDLFLKAWNLFPVKKKLSSFEAILGRSSQRLRERVEFLSCLQETSTTKKWLKEELKKSISLYTKADVQDIPVLLEVIQKLGAEDFEGICLPNLVMDKENYAFWIKLSETLVGYQEKVPQKTSRKKGESKSNTVIDNDGLTSLIMVCQKQAALRWSYVDIPQASRFGRPYYSDNTPTRDPTTRKIDRILEVIKLAWARGNEDVCRFLLLELVAKAEWRSTLLKHQELYTPLMPLLRGLTNMDMSKPPFVDFTRLAIGTCLQNVLGKCSAPKVNLRTMGCGCTVCKTLDRFIFDSNVQSQSHTFWEGSAAHAQQKVNSVTDLFTCQLRTGVRTSQPARKRSKPVSMPYFVLELQKRPGVAEATNHLARKKITKEFLASVGSDDVIREIMGPRYEDVQKSLMGVRQYVIEAQIQPIPANALIPSVSSANTGQKRKHL